MVKSLRHCWTLIKLLTLMALLGIIALAIWLHQGERTLDFAKPWIVSAVNSEDAPYRISIGQVSVKWTDVTRLGKLRITGVNLSKRDGSIFAGFPEVYASIDPIGFLPNRRLLHRVILREPRLFMARNAEGKVELGIEDAPSRMALDEFMAFFASDSGNATITPPSLPFHTFIIDNATFTFTDEMTQTKIVSTPFDFSLKRHDGTYDAALSMPFTVDEQPVMLSAALRALPKSREHALAVQLTQVPARLICLFGTCPEGVAAEGALDGNVVVAVADEDLAVHGFRAVLNTKKALLTLPKAFAEPLKMTNSTLTVEGNWAQKVISLTNTKLQLEDTTITASGKAQQKEDGWYITGDGEATQFEISKLYKYWPLFMAPDSRTWVTSKLKSGFADKGTLKLDITPTDLAAENFSEKAVDAYAHARDITFEYLPGFPLIQKMDGIAHFTGTTVKVEGGGGTLMNGTQINSAVLWCPDLAHPKNPMEATINLTAPAADAVTMLALKHFPFDDKFGLNAKTIKGAVDAAMVLKFNAFSENKNADPNELHLEAVDYDITTKFKDVAQDNVYGGYNVRGLNGELKANVKGMAIDAAVVVGDAGANQVKLNQDSGKPLTLSVKGLPAATKDTAKSLNDFNLTYVSGEVPAITVRGNRLDASVSYGGSDGGNSILADFPAMKLDVNLGELILDPAASFKEVVATLNCTKARCGSADFVAKAGDSSVRGGISSGGGSRQFVMTSNDAGATLKALGITDRMTKGRFDMRGTYDDSKTPPQLNSRLLITDFTLKNSQILARIFSIGSLTGLANALTGSGIHFEKLGANIISRGGIITVEKGTANGASMGITVEGEVNTNTTKLNLKGVVAPAYALNSILGKLPVIGALAGGGEGLIAFNYWVKGTYDDPDVGVNPLSGLTPGFLRGIFGVFDQKEQSDSDEAPKDKNAVGVKPTGAARRP